MSESRCSAAASAACRLLPAALVDLPIGRLGLRERTAEQLRAHDLRRVGDLLALTMDAFAPAGWLADAEATDLQRALGELLQQGLRPLEIAAANGDDWLALRSRLLAPLDDEERALLLDVVGLDGPAVPPAEIARRRSLSLAMLDQRQEQLRARLHQMESSVLGRLRYEIGRELQAFDGILHPEHAPPDSLLHVFARGSGDTQTGLRFSAFCFPRDLQVHRGVLCGTSPRNFRRLLRTLHRVVPPHRLPIAVSTVSAELAAEKVEVPHGLLLHVLRTELRLEIVQDPAGGQVAAPDPRSPSARLVDVLMEVGRPMQLEDLLFAYRERFRSASRTKLEQRLRRSPSFVMLGPDTWSLRRWHEQELLAVAPLVDKVARRLCTEGGRQNVAVLLADDKPGDRTIWLVLDRLAVDPRVRLLGRGDACPATHRRSQVLDQLLTDFRRAAGDVVMSMFVQNQPPARRRLVERLLRWNRLFVIPTADRIDLLSNYPFNEERLGRLVALVGGQLQQRTGYAHVAALKTLVDRTDLGGGWLTPDLLADLLRRHGPFEVLPGGLVGRRDLELWAFVMKTVRQALREAGEPLSVAEILRARPDLLEFSGCLQEMLAADPLLQTPDGAHFTLV